MNVILDSFAAGCAAKRGGTPEDVSEICRQWIDECELAGHKFYVPAVVYYEGLRELELRGATAQILRYKRFCLRPDRFIPLRRDHLEVAAKLWAEPRRAGRPTADRQSLDADVILAAQALSLLLPPSDFAIATTNPGHISRFVPAEHWSNIRP